MPIYEYACRRCRKVFSFLVRNIAAHKIPKCPRCGGKDMRRAISSFRIGQSDERRFEKLADSAALSGLDENDPKSLGRMMRTMSSELGEEGAGEMDEMAARLESGESPEEIEKSMGEGGGARDDSGDLYEG